MVLRPTRRLSYGFIRNRGDIMDALLVIDLQRGMFADPAMPPFDGDAVVRRSIGLIAAARAAGRTVLFVQHDGGAGDVLAADGPGFALHPALVPAPDDPILVKCFCSAFQDTPVAALLAARAVKKIAVCGMQTEYCIDTTCRAAFERGFSVTLASDAHTTFDSQALAAPAIIRHHNATLANAGFVTLEQAADLRFAG
jgi:nicotinamidase-related amidase